MTDKPAFPEMDGSRSSPLQCIEDPAERPTSDPEPDTTKRAFGPSSTTRPPTALQAHTACPGSRLDYQVIRDPGAAPVGQRFTPKSRAWCRDRCLPQRRPERQRLPRRTAGSSRRGRSRRGCGGCDGWRARRWRSKFRCRRSRGGGGRAGRAAATPAARPAPPAAGAAGRARALAAGGAAARCRRARGRARPARTAVASSGATPRRRARRRLFDNRQLQLVEEYFADLLRRIQVERLAGQRIRIAFDFQHAHTQLVRLHGQ